MVNGEFKELKITDFKGNAARSLLQKARTEWSLIQSVIIGVIMKSNLLITSMINQSINQSINNFLSVSESYCGARMPY